MEKEDIQYPLGDTAEDDEIYKNFMQLQIPGETISINFDDDDKKDDDDDSNTPQGPQDNNTCKQDLASHPPSQPPLADDQAKDKDAPQDKDNGTSHGKTQADKGSPRVMEDAMKGKVKSSFVSNPLLGLPNSTPTSARIVVDKEKDPYIEIIIVSELPRLLHLQLINNCNLIQKTLGSTLNLMEILRTSKQYIEEEHKGCKKQQEEASTVLAKTTQELMADHQQIEDTPTPPKKCIWGDNACKLKEITNERDEWRTKYLKAEATHAKGKMEKN